MASLLAVFYYSFQVVMVARNYYLLLILDFQKQLTITLIYANQLSFIIQKRRKQTQAYNIKNIITKMGLMQSSKTPSHFSYNEVKCVISELNLLFQQNKEVLSIELILIASRLAYNHSNWKQSTIPGKLTIQKQTQTVINKQPQETVQQGESVVLSVQGLYQLYNTMKHLKKDKRRQKSLRASKDLSEKIQKMTKFQTSTPATQNQRRSTKMASYIDPQQGKQCCICFQKMSTCALPCLHMFCDLCTIKYIIEKEEKKCPICRQVFEGTSQKVAKEVYTVIQQEQEVNQQIRQTILGILSVDNSRIISKVKEQKSQLLNIGNNKK